MDGVLQTIRVRSKNIINKGVKTLLKHVNSMCNSDPSMCHVTSYREFVVSFVPRCTTYMETNEQNFIR